MFGVSNTASKFFREGCLLSQAVVKEASARALILIPGAILTVSLDTTLNVVANGAVSAATIALGAKKLFSSLSNLSKSESRLYEIAESIRDIGIGSLLLTGAIYPQSVNTKTLVDHYYLISAIFSACLAVRHSVFAERKIEKLLPK